MEQGVLARYRDAIRRDGYAFIGDGELALGAGFRRDVVERYFGRLQRDLVDVHPNRGRLRSVFRYQRRGERFELSEQAFVDIVNRNHQGVRRYPRVELGDDPGVVRFVRTALSLLPPEQSPSASTFSINLFRTHGAVTMGPHRDHERYVVVHVLRKVGGGAHTVLYDGRDQTREVTTVCLEEGDTMILEDRRFYHHVTPLVSLGEPCVRDALVCTVDYPQTYGVCAGLQPGPEAR